MKASLERKPEIIVLPSVAERRQVHLINPRACGGKHAATAKKLAEATGGEVVYNDQEGHTEEFAAELFTKDKFAHLVVYGGDGTICEAVNGIMSSGNSHTASFSVIPFGSGNDFSAYANEKAGFRKAELQRLDLCEANGRYFMNMLNIGFDSNVVGRTHRLRRNPLIKGKFGYILGVAGELVAKRSMEVKVAFDGEEARDETLLLTACANGQFCGGGFRAAPLANLQDGLMDVLLVNDLTRRAFLSLVGDYREGTYISEDGTVGERFEDVIRYRRCREYVVSGIEQYCIDGELLPAVDGAVTVRCHRGAIWFAAL